MVKKKIEVKNNVLVNCCDCNNSKKVEDKLYCKTKLQDENILNDSAIVVKKIGCPMYRGAK